MSNATIVRAIGAGERKLSDTADMLVTLASADLDYAAKGVAAGEATRVVREWLGEEANERQANPDKSKTDFGRGFGSLVSAVKNRLTVKGETDWLALAVQAASNAHVKGEHSPEAIVTAITAALAALEEVPEAA